MYSRTALPVRGPQTVGSGIAAADDDDTLPLSRDRLVQDGIPGVSLVLLGEVIQRQMDALQLSPGNRQLPGLLGAECEADRVVLATQFIPADIHADIDAEFKLHPFGFHLLQPPVNDPFFHLEVGNAIAQQSPDTVRLLEDCHTMPLASQLLSSGEACRSRADDRHGLTGSHGRQNGLHPAFVKPLVDDVPLDDPDRHRVTVNPQDAGRLAGGRTEASSKFREIVRRMQRLQRILPSSAMNQIVPFGDEVHHRTAIMALAEGHPAVHTARALGFELVL